MTIPPHRKQRELELITAEHTYERPGRYIVAVKVIDILGNDTMTLCRSMQAERASTRIALRLVAQDHW